MLLRSALAFACFGLLAACAQEATERAGEATSDWTDYAGTTTLATGWQSRQVFEGDEDLWGPSRAGAFLRDGSGWSYAFPNLTQSSVVGVGTRPGASAPIEDMPSALGAVMSGVSTARGPAVLYDESWYHTGSRYSVGLRIARLGPTGWTSDVVDAKLRPDTIRVAVQDLCATERGGKIAAIYTAGSSYLNIADEQSDGAWDVKNVPQAQMLVGPRACAGGTQDLWFSLGGDVFDKFRIVRHRAGEAGPSAGEQLPIGPLLRGASIAISGDDTPVVAYADATTLRLAKRSAAGTWNVEVLPAPFPADELRIHSLSLTLVAGEPVLTMLRTGHHPTATGIGRDGLWLYRRVNGAWRATELFTPPGGWLRAHGVVVNGNRMTIGLAHWAYAGAYRNVVIEGPLP